MHALLVGLHSGKFLDTLYAESLEDMDQLRARTTRYMSIKENTDAQRRAMKAPTSIITRRSALSKGSSGGAGPIRGLKPLHTLDQVKEEVVKHRTTRQYNSRVRAQMLHRGRLEKAWRGKKVQR
ncbi:hypothetical protein VNO80_25045 [Phaseolus coccineus]|uniref:Uncharacterized protein n=1 Tax=Phaseolus coccineus TaxID=3886 RepID=A0AAN9LTV1_PHACN